MARLWPARPAGPGEGAVGAATWMLVARSAIPRPRPAFRISVGSLALDAFAPAVGQGLGQERRGRSGWSGCSCGRRAPQRVRVVLPRRWPIAVLLVTFRLFTRCLTGCGSQRCDASHWPGPPPGKRADLRPGSLRCFFVGSYGQPAVMHRSAPKREHVEGAGQTCPLDGFPRNIHNCHE